MREIKFRAWDKDAQQMLQVDAIALAENAFEWGPGVTDEHNDFHAMSDVELMQFTGLKDKNGVECYEGDIIKLFRHSDITHKHEPSELWTPDGRVPYVVEVKFVLGAFCFSGTYAGMRTFQNLARPGESFEVIGNIYENPELLPLATAKDA